MRHESTTLVFATQNAHKAREIAQILGPKYRILTLCDIGCREEIPETAETLEGNALLKARYVKERYGYDCFAEDTGLEVEALNGAPGVRTARYAGDTKDPEANMALLLTNMAGKENRRARFRTVIACIFGERQAILEGVCYGIIAPAKRGTGGFGYDPIFIPEGYSQTFAELGEEIKNRISHRAQATERFRRWLENT
ncbi:MAG: non-canonical purine NTP diphosphatase [Saprospiraceae bacterium]|nr:non-canonical purine NTP diphosphatase [Saprospiraceae bacterium]MDW8482987.1 non-canonical purine NTP diphosphatase [Saprospiraceae bacterium]